MNSSQINSKLVTVSGAVCATLLLILIGELFYAKQVQKQLLSSSLSAEKNAAQDDMPQVDLTKRSEESYEDMVSRPLFLEGRKPVPEPTAEQTQANAVAVKFDWLLNGVYTTTKGLSALFTRASKVPKGNYRKIKQGDDLDGWKLSEIQKDKVILTQDGNRKELLLRKPKLKQLAQKRSNAPPQPAADAEVPGAPVAEPPPESEQLPESEPESPEDSFENSDNEQF